MTQRLVEEVGVRLGTPGQGEFCKAKQIQLLALCGQQGGLVQEDEMKAAFQSDEGKPGGLWSLWDLQEDAEGSRCLTPDCVD